MNTLLVLSALLGATLAQVPIPWMGPFADHINGQLVPDTPEVAAAKRQHAEAHTQIRAILPELSLEERFPEGHVPHHPVIIPQVVQQPQVHFPHHVVVPDFMPHATFTQFAEEIPRSPLGEVPEVAAARLAHLKAISEIRAVLPILASTTVAPGQFVHPVQPVAQAPWNTLPQDTPEVAAAKLEHARAVAAAFGH